MFLTKYGYAWAPYQDMCKGCGHATAACVARKQINALRPVR